MDSLQHIVPGAHGVVYALVVALGGAAGAGLLGLGLAAFLRRRSRSYLLVVLALGALVARTLVSALAIFGPLDPALHHFAEHALDAMVATFLLGAIYYARTSGAIAAEGSK